MTATGTGGSGQESAAATARSNSFSTTVILPSAAMHATTACKMLRFTAGLDWAS